MKIETIRCRVKDEKKHNFKSISYLPYKSVNKFSKSKSHSLFENFINNNKKPKEDYNCCYNISNKNFYKFNTNINQKEDQININIIYDTESVDHEEKFRNTFLTSTIKSNYKYETKEVKLGMNEHSLNFREMLNQVSAVQKQIKNESDEIKILMGFTKMLKCKISKSNGVEKFKINNFSKLKNFKLNLGLKKNNLNPSINKGNFLPILK